MSRGFSEIVDASNSQLTSRIGCKVLNAGLRIRGRAMSSFPEHLTRLRRSLGLEAFAVNVPSYVNYDDYMHGYTRAVFDRAKQISELEEYDSRQRSSHRDIVFVSGLLLITYGNLDVLEDTLDSVPEAYSNAYHMLDTLIELFPLPVAIYSADWYPDGPGRIRAWYLEHRGNLIWSEEEGRFLLGSG
jgi:hypothetical protein